MVRVSVNVSRLKSREKKLRARFFKSIRGVLRNEMKRLRAEVISTRMRSGGLGSTYSKLTIRQPGVVSNSFKYGTRGSTLDTLEGFYGFPRGTKFADPALIQEFGGTIFARNKMLAIPLRAARRTTGVPIYKSPRDAGVLFAKRSRKSGRTILYRRGPRNSLTPMFVLVESTQHISPGRLKLRATMLKNIPKIAKRMAYSGARVI